MTKMITDLIDQLTYSSEVQLFLVKVILLRTLFFFTQNLGAYHNNYHHSFPHRLYCIRKATNKTSRIKF